MYLEAVLPSINDKVFAKIHDALKVKFAENIPLVSQSHHDCYSR